jgi:simple sugar transport system permease protein
MTRFLRMLAHTKLYWGLLVICLIGALASPHTSTGRNIFLSYANLTDVLRQVSITGLVATGMTIVILLGGIDLSVGSVVGFSTIICAMLLTKAGWTTASAVGLPAAVFVTFAAIACLTRFVLHGIARGRDVTGGARREIRLSPWQRLGFPALLGLSAAAFTGWFAWSELPTKFGLLGVLLITPCVALLLGAVNGLLIVTGRLQPFIVTLAMMVSALGIGRLTAGQDNAVIAVYTGTNATEAFEVLRSMLWGLVPVPSAFFLAAIVIFGAILRFTTFGRYIYAIGGNAEVAKLSGIKVAQVQFTAYMLSGLLAGIAGVLFVAQYRQGKPDAGAGLELDAIAAVVIGGTSLMGGRGGLVGTFVGVLIFGLLSDILQLQNIDSNVQLVMKGLIIVCTVLMQEQSFGQLVARWRLPTAKRASQTGGGRTRSPAERLECATYNGGSR